MKEQSLPLPVAEGPRIEMHNGCCLEVMPTLPAGGADMVFADLPYGCTSNPWDFEICLQSLWVNLKRVQRKKAAAIFTSNFRLGVKLVESNKKQFRYDLVWAKNRPTGHLNAKRQPLRIHENVLVFCSEQTLYVPQTTEGIPFSRGTRPSNANYGRVKQGHAHSNVTGERQPTSIIAASTEQAGIHPTAKPIALLEYIIRTYTNEGDTVLDPVFGSGTTAVACLRTGRNFVGVEQSPEYFEVARKRIAEEQARLGFRVTV